MGEVIKPKFPGFHLTESGDYEYKEYQTEHIVSGDTDSVYVNIDHLSERKTKEDIASMADGISAYANSLYPDFMQSVFNCPDIESEVMKTEREIVSDKSYFLTKKRYFMHVVNDEGEWVDDYKVTGLEIIKSDTPLALKEILRELILMILDDWTREEVLERIEEVKKEYRTKSLREIGRPMNVKVLTEYQDKFNQTGSMKGFPYHVRASMFHNMNAGPRDLKVRSGDKVILIYLDNKDTKYTAFPIDSNHDPEYIKEMKIDWKRQWETVEKKIENYLKPVQWDKKGARRLSKKELFG